MIRLLHVYFPGRTLLLALSDAALICLALLAAFLTSFGADATLALTYEKGYAKILLASVVCMLCMHYYDLYEPFVVHSPGEMLTRLVQVLGTCCLVLALLYYAYPDAQLGRGLFLMWVTLAGISLVAWRKLFYRLNHLIRLKERVAFLGDSPLMDRLAQQIITHPELGLELVGCINLSSGHGESNSGVPRLECPGDLVTVIDRKEIRRIILTMSDRRGKLPIRELLDLKRRGALIEDGADVYEAITGRVHMDSLLPGRLLFSYGFRISRAMLLWKRAGSILFATLGLLASLPLTLLIALAIRLDSAGPVIFRQKRVGKDGKDFTLYKFRSMVHESDPNGKATPAEEHDRRFTRLGRWLRRSRLDELPQLYNILKGDMYLIGPRPFARDMEQDLVKTIPFYEQRWTVKPGATGWAQIHRGYCSSLEDNTEKLSYDLFYIKNLSLGLDILIFFQTLKILILGRGSR